MKKNVYGTELLECSSDPLTGFYRDGCCHSGADDAGLHMVCAIMTDDFLEYSKSVGNDLSTPVPQYGFPGLKAGDRWCVCLQRWVQAHAAGKAPRIFMRGTDAAALTYVPLDVLKEYAIDED